MGSFLFWLIWPYIVARKTRIHCIQYTGRDISEERMKKFQRDLARITRDMMKPVPDKTSR